MLVIEKELMRRQQTQLGEFFSKKDDPVLITTKCVDSSYTIEYYNPTMQRLGYNDQSE
jgi:hypothetical protein